MKERANFEREFETNDRTKKRSPTLGHPWPLIFETPFFDNMRSKTQFCNEFLDILETVPTAQQWPRDPVFLMLQTNCKANDIKHTHTHTHH